MNALVICPAERPAVRALSESGPLANHSLFGKNLLVHWLEHLASLGATKICVLASDGPEQIAAVVGSGSRWGLTVQVIPEAAELSVRDARFRYKPKGATDWLAGPGEVVLAHHLPGMPDRDIFTSYAEFFAAINAWLPKAAAEVRVGLREIQPGVWAGLHTKIAESASLRGPLWIGEAVRIGRDAIVGPNVTLEDRVLVDTGAEIRDSHIGLETYVGCATSLADSMAFGSTLVNWRRNWVTKIPDPFLLGSLETAPSERRVAEFISILPGEQRQEALVPVVKPLESEERSPLGRPAVQ